MITIMIVDNLGDFFLLRWRHHDGAQIFRIAHQITDVELQKITIFLVLKFSRKFRKKINSKPQKIIEKLMLLTVKNLA